MFADDLIFKRLICLCISHINKSIIFVKQIFNYKKIIDKLFYIVK
ncbi:hypothetical protein pb186bvf_016736 [Paramecium bursaria]